MACPVSHSCMAMNGNGPWLTRAILIRGAIANGSPGLPFGSGVKWALRAAS